jgi:hypothetical protein
VAAQVGLATVGAFMHYYMRAGVGVPLLRTWTQCSDWEGSLMGLSSACEAFDPSKGKLGASATAVCRPASLNART